MTITEQIITTFTEQVDTGKEYTRVELSKMLTEIYNNHNKGKKKREPSSYNLYLKEQMSIVKEEFPDLSGKDLMKKIGEMWKEKKEKEKKVMTKVTEIWKNKEKSEEKDEEKEEGKKEENEEEKQEEKEEEKQEDKKEEKKKRTRKTNK